MSAPVRGLPGPGSIAAQARAERGRPLVSGRSPVEDAPKGSATQVSSSSLAAPARRWKAARRSRRDRPTGRIAACLKSHEADLSKGCKDQIAAAKVKVKAFVDACKPDAEKLCQGIPIGEGRILACLVSHQADLSPACKAEMAK
jgi:hypothetical protein